MTLMQKLGAKYCTSISFTTILTVQNFKKITKNKCYRTYLPTKLCC